MAPPDLPSTSHPTLEDVAKVAGVSRSTVSRVVNGDASVSDNTRERVRRAIDSLDYRPNLSARSLVSRRSGALGLLMSAVSGIGPQCDAAVIQAAARSAGLRVFTQIAEEPDTQGIERAAAALAELRVDVIICLGPQAVLAHAGVAELSVPVVVVESGPQWLPLAVGVDNVLGARLATEHLLGLGHRSVVHLAGPEGWNESEARIQGWRSAMEAGEVGNPHLFRAENWSADSAFRVGQEIAGLDGVSAVFCASDHLALGMLSALRDRGLDVPGDVSVVGFDDVAEAAHFTPPLTTIRQDFHELARRAVAMAGAAIEGVAGLPDLVVPRLVVRRSTAPRRP